MKKLTVVICCLLLIGCTTQKYSHSGIDGFDELEVTGFWNAKGQQTTIIKGGSTKIDSTGKIVEIQNDSVISMGGGQTTFATPDQLKVALEVMKLFSSASSVPIPSTASPTIKEIALFDDPKITMMANGDYEFRIDDNTAYQVMPAMLKTVFEIYTTNGIGAVEALQLPAL